MGALDTPVPVDPITVPMGTSCNRLICKQLESPSVNIFVTVPRHTSHVGECSSSSVAKVTHTVCIPPDNDSRQSVAKDPEGTAATASPGRARVHRSHFVSLASTTPVRDVTSSSGTSGRPASTALALPSSTLRAIQSAPLVCQFPALRKSGFSEAVV